MKLDTIELVGSWVDVSEYQKGCSLLHIDVKINNEVVETSNSVDVFRAYSNWFNSNNGWYPQQNRSCFYLFSCSCGDAGCAGIWNGIRVKVRKNTVEWRVKKKDGYEFLDKTFYSFDHKQYEKAYNDFFFWLGMQDDVDSKLCTDLGYYEGGETTVDQFFEWVEQQ
tara:strand:+ start:16608 stop:17105 length:498 start_codon:yes stop_codon:yes gene_type:complete